MDGNRKKIKTAWFAAWNLLENIKENATYIAPFFKVPVDNILLKDNEFFVQSHTTKKECII
jgi:hypothetical protein